MRLYTPRDLKYPVEVTTLSQKKGDTVEQNAPLFAYKFKATNNEWSKDKGEWEDVERTYYSNFESEIEGEITSLGISVGQKLHGRTFVAEIEEPCRHEVQFGGLCANCSQDMTLLQYNTTRAGTDRAKVNTFHGHTALLISEDEATKADAEIKRRLLDARKLSLVVDLDQTIIHATVDPTVAEWQQDTSNPNYDAVKDVRAFQLVDDGPGARGTWYYIKLRPGLKEFLESIAEHYELHIYTMATRAYAENISKIVDPDRKLFGDRILSRDENGSMTSKSLKRLFPVDTKMVVIIDDRGDVWSWSPNLVKVSPYDFFVGIGDINSSFLPKRPEIEARPTKSVKPAEKKAEDAQASSSEGKEETNGTSAASSTEALVATTEAAAVNSMMSMAGKLDEDSMKEKADEQEQTIAAQLEDRPLMKMQKILDTQEEEAKTSPAAEAAAEILSEEGKKPEDASEEASAPKYRHNLLQDDDGELKYLAQSLKNIHSAFFDEYNKDRPGLKGGRLAELKPGHSKKRSIDELETIPDAAVIMSDMKRKVLSGVHLVFSGVIPIGVDIQSHDIAVWAKSFGATVSDSITKQTTHLIASPERRTAKVRQAAKKGGRVAIVNQNWLYACFSQWKKVDEDEYRVHSAAPANGNGGLPDSFENKDLMLSSSDEEAAQTEDEIDVGPGKGPADGEGEEEDDDDKYLPSYERERSPILEMGNFMDDDLEAELKAELGEDWDDDSEDGDENKSTKSDSSQGDKEEDEEERDEEEKDKTSKRPEAKKAVNEDEDDKKRKRETLDSGEEEGSRLQKRKRQALSRVSSLNNVHTAVAEEEAEEGSESGEDAEDDLTAAFEAEFES